MDDLLLGAVYGLGLGVVAGGTLSVTGPFARGDERGWECVSLLVALGALSVGGGMLVLDSWPVAWVAAVGTATGVGLFWLLGRGTSEPDAADFSPTLSAAELRRPKTQDDCWVLVTGSPTSGKTTLIERLVAEARGLDRVRLATPSRFGQDGDVSVTELQLQAPGRGRTLRLWERTWGEGSPSRPAPRDLDGVVVAIDPTCVNGTAGSFPSAVKAGPGAVDVNAHAIALDASLAKARQQVVAWHVVTKADLVRFSIDASLVKLVKAGTGWYEQLRGFDITGRRELADSLGIDTTERTALQQGQGSPFLAYEGRGPSGRGAFGAGSLLRAIIDTLIPEASRNRGDYRAP